MKQFTFIILVILFAVNCKCQDTSQTKSTDLDLSFGAFNSFTKNKVAFNPAIAGYVGEYYFENRYNYEAANSASINAGKKIFRNLKHVEIIPMGGLVFGSFKGITAELQTSLDLNRWILSFDNQISFEYTEPGKSVYLNWNVVRFKLFQFFQVGATSVLQQQLNSKAIFDKGLSAALLFNKWSMRFYAYNYPSEKWYCWLGIRYNIRLRLNKK